MPEGWREIALGEVARLDIEGVPVEPDTEYSMAGLLGAGRGLFWRETIVGRETAYRTLHRLRAGCLVMRKLTAGEGPITVVPDAYDGAFVSTEFPTFTLDQSRLLPDYMRLICQLPSFHAEMRMRAAGTAERRKRLSPSGLLAISVMLPPLDEQRRIASVLVHIDELVLASRSELSAAARFGRHLRACLLGDPVYETTQLREVVDVTMGRQRSPKHQTGEFIVPYLRAANVKDGFLALDDVLSMNFAPREQAKYELLSGDVLVTEGCGSLRQIGANAVWRGDLADVVCFQNTLLRLRAIEGKTLSSFVAHWARFAFESGAFADIASGTNIFHIGAMRANGMAFPVLPLDRQKEIAAVLDDVQAVESAVSSRLEALASLRASAASSLLSGSHEIPGSYDRFLCDETPADTNLESVTV